MKIEQVTDWDMKGLNFSTKILAAKNMAIRFYLTGINILLRLKGLRNYRVFLYTHWSRNGSGD